MCVGGGGGGGDQFFIDIKCIFDYGADVSQTNVHLHAHA